MGYVQLTEEERYGIAALRMLRRSIVEIAAKVGRHRSTIYRELKRNRWESGQYGAARAVEMTRARRKRSRRNSQYGEEEFAKVEELLKEEWSPEQIRGRLGGAMMSHETMYRHIWKDKRRGGELYLNLRGARKKRRKRYGRKDSRGRLAGKRMIQERPEAVERRSRLGDWEMDTVMGQGKACVLTAVERKSGYVVIGKLADRTVKETNRRLIERLGKVSGKVRTITADNGTEFHGYKEIEEKTGAVIYFANPHHAWERGSNENANGLIRQYLPKGVNLTRLTQRECNLIAEKLNNRPRKRLGYKTPNECFNEN
jgi:IS30 family transposase